MSYDPYKSLLANATREHPKRSTDLNTHLVGNVFLPAIDFQHKKHGKSQASLKHLKMIEQCIMAENKREQRLVKCVTMKERRVLSKKFQVQREHERELIQTLMLGKFSEGHQKVELLETEIFPATTPQHQLNQDVTGLTARVATPDRVFRKADFTGGIPKSKPHTHKKFTLPLCNGSPGKKSNAKAQAAAATTLSFSSRGSSSSDRGPRCGVNELLTRSRLPRSATTVRSPKSEVKQVSHQLKARTTPRMIKPEEVPDTRETLDVNINSEDQQHESFSVAFEGARSFSAVDPVANISNLVKATVSADTTTQTTPRLLESEQNSVKKAIPRPELPPMASSLRIEVKQNATATTPRRPQSCQAIRPTRQVFLDNLAKDAQNRNVFLPIMVYRDPAPITAIDASEEQQQVLNVDLIPTEEIETTDTNEEQQIAVEVDNKPLESEESTDYDAEEFDLTDEEAEDSNEELETDVAEILFDMIDMVDAEMAKEEQQKVNLSPRTVSPRPRPSMSRETKYVLQIQSVFRGYRARIAFRLALYEDAMSCGVLGAMPGTIQGRSGWYLDPKRLIAYYFSIPDPDGEWEQKFMLRCSRLVLTPFEMREEVLSKVPDEEKYQ